MPSPSSQVLALRQDCVLSQWVLKTLVDARALEFSSTKVCTVYVYGDLQLASI